jgi:phage gp36-like protein
VSVYPNQYASIAQIQTRFDIRTLAGASTDDGSGVLNTVNLNDVLQDASAKITSAIRFSSRYTADQVAALIASGDTLLVRLCCNLAYGYLILRRGTMPESVEGFYTHTLETLDQIRTGKLLLNIPGVGAASTPVVVSNTAAQNANLLPMASNDFLGGPSDTRSTTDPGTWGSASYGSTQTYYEN